MPSISNAYNMTDEQRAHIVSRPVVAPKDDQALPAGHAYVSYKQIARRIDHKAETQNVTRYEIMKSIGYSSGGLLNRWRGETRLVGEYSDRCVNILIKLTRLTQDFCE